MNVCLIAPPAVRIRYNISGVHPLPPLGLAYIAAVLVKEGFNVEIVDMIALKMSLRELGGYLKNRHFDVYGITCNVFNLKCGMDIADLVKRADSRSLVVLGGRCAAFPSADIFERCNSFDVIVRGEGEMTMLELCNLLRDNPKSLDGLPGIKGLAFKKAGQSIDTADREYLDFDSLPFPARHLLPNNRYRMHPPFGIRPPLAIMETSRGCVYKCNFCGLFTSLRERSVPNIISEIEQLINKYKIKELHFVDPNFTYNQERLRDLCNALIKNRFGLAWSCKQE